MPRNPLHINQRVRVDSLEPGELCSEPAEGDGQVRMPGVIVLLLVAVALAVHGCGDSSSPNIAGGSSSPATTATAALSETELAAFNNFVDNGTVLNANSRRCLATPFLRAFGVEKLKSFGAGIPLSEKEAEQTYEMFKVCASPLAVFNVLYPANRTVDQSRCLNEYGPPESEAKRLTVGLFQGNKISLSDEVRAQAQAAVAKCIGATATTTVTR